MIELIIVGLASGGAGVILAVILNYWASRPRVPDGDPPEPYEHRRGVPRHGHEFNHNPGDGYFYCSTPGCNRRKKLGGL